MVGWRSREPWLSDLRVTDRAMHVSFPLNSALQRHDLGLAHPRLWASWASLPVLEKYGEYLWIEYMYMYSIHTHTRTHTHIYKTWICRALWDWGRHPIYVYICVYVHAISSHTHTHYSVSLENTNAHHIYVCVLCVCVCSLCICTQLDTILSICIYSIHLVYLSIIYQKKISYDELAYIIVGAEKSPDLPVLFVCKLEIQERW